VDHPAELVARLAAADDRAGPVPMFVFDAGYDPIALTHALTDLRASVVVRIRDDRVFYPDPVAPAPGTVGRPRRHGPRFGCADPTSWPDPDDELTTTDSRYGTVRVLAWHGLHPKLGRRGRWARHEVPPIVRGTVIRVEVEHLPKPTARAKKTLWLWAAGPEPVDLHICWRAYLRRFDIEHTYLPVREEHAGLDHPRAAHPRASRPLDLARRHQLHPATPGPPPRRRPPSALGTDPRAGQAHPGPRPPRISPTWRDHRHPGQPTEIRQARTWTTTRHPYRPPNPPPSDQEGRLTHVKV